MAFPVNYKLKAIEGKVGNSSYYGFSLPRIFKVLKIKAIERMLLRKYLNDILKKTNPDILHVFGTEMAHSRIAVECFNKPDKTIIHIQGMVSICAKHCTLGFPFFIKYLWMPISVFKGTINSLSRRWEKAGKDEIISIQKSGYVMGRTEWDEACTKQINSSVNYIHCGETLRSSFYEDSSQWQFEKCTKHSIYFSQSSSQVKGLHLVLPILPELIKKYPDVHLYIGGNDPVGKSNIKSLLRRSPLGWYLKHQIKKYKLDKFVTFLGVQNEQQVVQNLKDAHVFLSASLIENSPNSVGEALVVGTPVVSSDVGGVKDFIKHGENGFIYPDDEPYMIPYYIGKLFDDTELAERFSEVGRELGREKYSAEDNGRTILSTYKKILEN
jgi:glycosyltransferase involved in cell wall biosynthesis